MKKVKIALLVAAALSTSLPAAAAEINVMSGGATKEALKVLVPAFEKLTGHHVVVKYVVISELQKRIIAGESPDLVLMPVPVISELTRSGKLQAEGAASFGTVSIVVIVKEGAARPDVATPEAFRDTLLHARSIVYSRPSATPSGAHLARVIEQLKIADAVAPKVTYRPALEGGVEMVANGEAEIGMFPSSEVGHVEGVVRAGFLPDALQQKTTYGGATVAANGSPEPARAFLAFLAREDSRKYWGESGFD